MTTLFVTGGAGFIGSNFIRYWLSTYPDDRIVNYDLLTYAGNLASLQDVEENYGDRYTFVRGDIQNADLTRHLFEVHRPDYVVNFAAESHNSLAIVNPSAFFQTNVVGTQKLLQAASDAQVPRFHHISTCEVYGDLALDADESFSEESPYRPRTPYNAAKAAADLAVRAYGHTFGLPVTLSNCANNFGPYQFPEKVIPFFVVRLLTGQKMPLYKSSQNRREWLHVDDHCRAIDLVLKKGEIGETYNVGSGIEKDVETIADLILDALGLDATRTKPTSKTGPATTGATYSIRAKSAPKLGWEPQVDFAESFRDTVHWYRDNEAWWRPLLKKIQVREEGW